MNQELQNTDKITTEIKIEVENIKVIPEYFSFNYQIWINGEEVKNGKYDDSHGWHYNDLSGFEAVLKNHWAIQLVLEQIDLSKYIPEK